MKKLSLWILVIALVVGCGEMKESAAAAPDVDIWRAAARGDIEAIKQHLEAGTDVDAKEPPGGSTPLIVAAAYGQVEAAKLLIEKGASVNASSNDGATALHAAAFFCHTDTVKLLLDRGARVNAKNIRGETALDSVAGEWSQELEGIYVYLAGVLRIELDLEQIYSLRPVIADILRKHANEGGSEPLKGTATSAGSSSASTTVDIWGSAAAGDLQTLRQHIATGTDVNAKESAGGSTPTIVAAAYGQTEVAELLVKHGADLEARNNDGNTALMAAAFLCHADTVKLLLDKGANVNSRNTQGETPLDLVAGEWSAELEQTYQSLTKMLNTELDLERIYTQRPVIANTLRQQGGKTTAALDGLMKPTGFRGSYYVNGEIHVNIYGAPEGKPLTTGHADFKPSWSKTGDMLVFFRRLKDDPIVANWKTAICIINVDGTGFHQLTDGTNTDFNHTWTRDGSNTPIWNRQNPQTGGFYVMKSKVGAQPGQEIAISDNKYHTWAYTCLKDGRVLVQSAHPEHGWGYFLMTPEAEEEPRYERIDCALATKGLLDRLSVSPSEERICFEFQKGFEYKDPGRTLYMADFDGEARTITNAKAIANEDGAPVWFAYPRWVKDETAIVYHAGGKLYLYALKDGTTRRVSTNLGADYRYPHGEDTPK